MARRGGMLDRILIVTAVLVSVAAMANPRLEWFGLSSEPAPNAPAPVASKPATSPIETASLPPLSQPVTAPPAIVPPAKEIAAPPAPQTSEPVKTQAAAQPTALPTP